MSVNQKEEKNGENLPESSLTFGLFFLLRQFKITKASLQTLNFIFLFFYSSVEQKEKIPASSMTFLNRK